MPNEAKFLSIAKATVENFNEVGRKKGHKKIIDIFQNSLLVKLFTKGACCKGFIVFFKLSPKRYNCTILDSCFFMNSFNN